MQKSKLKILINYFFVLLFLIAPFTALISEADATNHLPATTPAQTTDTSTGKPLVKYSGVESTIESYLCTPTSSGNGLVNCVNKLYRVGIVVGGMLLVFFIVLAGYMYITGGENGKTKAKELIYSTLTGLAVLLSSYLLLNFINPSLTTFRPIQPPIFSAADLPSCEDVGFEADCILGGQVITAGGSGGSCSDVCANLAHIDPSVTEGQIVKAGQQIGVTTVYRGDFGPHLHFELMLGGQWIVGDGKKGTWDNMKAAISKCLGSTCAMPMKDSFVTKYNNSVHNEWGGSKAYHRTVRLPPNSPPATGAVDLGVSTANVPIYSPINGKVTKLRILKDGTGGYVSISSGSGAGAGSNLVKASSVVVDMQYALAKPSSHNFMGKALYTGNNAKYGTDCYLSAGTAAKIEKASAALDSLKKGWKIKAWDCFRPPEVQQEMYSWSLKTPGKKGLVAPPETAQHPQGKSIDATLVDEKGKDVLMPTHFDFYVNQGKQDPGSPAYNALPKELRDNAQILNKVMTGADLVRAGNEWWHFGDK